MGVSPSKKINAAKCRNGPSQMLLQGFQTWQHHLECSCWIFFWGQPTRKNKVPATKSWGKSETTKLIMTYYDILWPYHIINKSDKSGDSSKQTNAAEKAMPARSQSNSFGPNGPWAGRKALSAHPQRRKVVEKNIPPEIKNKANYIISKFWVKFQCTDPLQQKRRITIAPLRFQVIKIQIIQALHVVLHLAAVGWVGPWQKSSSPIVHSWPRYPRRPWLTPSGPSCWLPQPQNGWPVSTCPNMKNMIRMCHVQAR